MRRIHSIHGPHATDTYIIKLGIIVKNGHFIIISYLPNFILLNFSIVDILNKNNAPLNLELGGEEVLNKKLCERPP